MVPFKTSQVYVLYVSFEKLLHAGYVVFLPRVPSKVDIRYVQEASSILR
jgi:hypothetical protein